MEEDREELMESILEDEEEIIAVHRAQIEETMDIVRRCGGWGRGRRERVVGEGVDSVGMYVPSGVGDGLMVHKHRGTRVPPAACVAVIGDWWVLHRSLSAARRVQLTLRPLVTVPLPP